VRKELYTSQAKVELCSVDFLTSKVKSSVNCAGEFSVWSDAYVSNGIAVLICIAQGGFHTQVSYEWKRSKCVTCRWPITYEEVPGTYSCTISGLNIMAKQIFHVEGK